MNEKKNKKNYIITILVVLVISFLISCYFVNYFDKDKNNEDVDKIQNLYLINVNGYGFENVFAPQSYDYNVTVDEPLVEINCVGDSDIIGCNVILDLTGKDNYLHQIKLYNGKENVTYNINISIAEKEEINENFYIKEVVGNPLEWTTEDIILKVIMSNDRRYDFSFDGGVTWQESDEFLVEENMRMQIIARDSLTGALSSFYEVEIDKIDKWAPAVTINKSNATDKKVAIEVITWDDFSGVDSISFQGGEYSKQTNYDITVPGIYYVNVKDKAGNVSQKTYVTINESDFIKKEKIFTLTLQGNGSKSEKNSVSCTTTENSCYVILPSIITEHTALGWSITSNSKSANYNQGAKIELTKDLTLYAITRKTFTVTFDRNGSDYLTYKKLSCLAYNTENSCDVVLPSIATEHTALGWGITSDSKSANYSQGTKISLTKDLTLYAITKKTFTATFVKDGLDYLESEKLSCVAYNTEKSCSIVLPRFNKKGHFNSFWGTSKSVSSNLVGTVWTSTNFNQVGHLYTLSKDVTLYPNFNHKYYNYYLEKVLYKFRNFNVSVGSYVGDSYFEFESGIPTTVMNNFLKAMNSAYLEMPWLFTPGKVFIMTEETYANHSKAYGVTHMMTGNSGGVSYFTIDLKYDSSGSIVKNAIDINAALHELAHAWDIYYYFRTGSSRISSTGDFAELYKSLDSKLYIYSDGTKISEIETFAAMVTNYYWHILEADTAKGFYAIKSGYSMSLKEKANLKKFLEKYISISQNNYK